MNTLESTAFIAAPSIIIMFGLILLLISQITRPDPYEPILIARHMASINETEQEIIEGIIEDLEAYPQVGRRGRYSVARAIRVADDWMPYIGDRLVTVLMESTAEFLFVRRPVDQLTDPYQRAQWRTDLATIR